MLSEILNNYGPDSFIGRVASVMQGSTDTTIYIISLYFASIGVKKIKIFSNSRSTFRFNKYNFISSYCNTYIW